LSDAERNQLNMAPQAFDKADISKFIPGSGGAGAKP
jgi:hypothetical protein